MPDLFAFFNGSRPETRLKRSEWDDYVHRIFGGELHERRDQVRDSINNKKHKLRQSSGGDNEAFTAKISNLPNFYAIYGSFYVGYTGASLGNISYDTQTTKTIVASVGK